MDKAFIIAEIKRTAAANGGKPLGAARFAAETGINKYDWLGKHWARWSEALVEAGYEPNEMQQAYDNDWVIEQMIDFIRELRRYPAVTDIRIKSRKHPTFPDKGVFARLGRKEELAAKIIDYCSARDGLDDVAEICRPIAAQAEVKPVDVEVDGDEPTVGYVYLMKSGKHHKIGHSNAAGRREYELGIQLPERVTTVHTISTDDPAGIEAYWHKRFDAKRLNGEWFNLDPAEIRAFKRRKFM